MSEPKIKRIQIEKHVAGDRLAATKTDGKQWLAMIARLEEFAEYCKNGVVQVIIGHAQDNLTEIAQYYDFLPREETVSEDATPETLTEGLAAQSPPKVEVPQ